MPDRKMNMPGRLPKAFAEKEGSTSSAVSLALIETLTHNEGAPDQAAEPLGVLHGAARIIKRLESVYGRVPASVSIFQPDGQLRRVAAAGPLHRLGRTRSTRRRQAMESGRVVRIAVRAVPNHTLFISPLIARGIRLGVVEYLVRATDARTKERLGQSIVDAGAEEIRRAQTWAPLLADRDFLPATRLATDVGEATSAAKAIEAIVDHYFQHYRVPVAAWLDDSGRGEAELVAVRGFEGRSRAALRRRIPTLASRPSKKARQLASEDFRKIARVDGVTFLGLGGAILIAGVEANSARASMDAAGRLIRAVLAEYRAAAIAEGPNAQLELAIALAAHQVRDPLLGARAAIERLLEEDPPPELRRDLLRRSGMALGRLASLVDAILAVETGRRHRSRQQLDRLVSNAIESCALDPANRTVTTDLRSHAVIDADPDQIRSAVANVIRNAVAYSPADSTITVSVKAEGRAAVVSVTDRGPGVLRGERSAIFEPFFRGASGSEKDQGAGLGLFFTRRVVEAHGGRVWVESAGQGSAFVIRLPTAAPSKGAGSAGTRPTRSAK
jgi:signal transduction histidine kinase